MSIYKRWWYRLFWDTAILPALRLAKRVGLLSDEQFGNIAWEVIDRGFGVRR